MIRNLVLNREPAKPAIGEVDDAGIRRRSV